MCVDTSLPSCLSVTNQTSEGEKKQQQLNEGDECDRAWQITTKTVENIAIRPLYEYFFSKNPPFFCVLFLPYRLSCHQLP